MVCAVVLILVGIFILVRISATTFAPKGRGALQITTNVKSQVTLNGKDIGTTPVCLCEDKTIIADTYDLKITPSDTSLQPFSAKVDVNGGVLTAIERTFLPGALASSYILTLEKTNISTPQIFIATVPDNALISIDGDSKGATPFSQNLSASEHEVEIEKNGFAKKTVRVRAVANYKLILNVILGTDTGLEDSVPTTAPTPVPSETISPTQALQTNVLITNTPTGFLRVRATPSVGGTQIAEVKPGEKYIYVDENDSWFEIQLNDGSKGWVSKSYTQKVNQ